MSARHKQKFSGGRDSPDEPSRPPRKEDKSRTVGSRTGLNTYWISGEGIVREVLQRQICRMLGNEARSQPGEYNVGDYCLMRRTSPLTFAGRVGVSHTGSPSLYTSKNPAVPFVISLD